MKYGKTFTEALREVSKLQEDGHTDVASAVRQCKTAIEDASEMLSKLQGMNPEGDLPSWWMNKIAIAANSMNKLRDYLLILLRLFYLFVLPTCPTSPLTV